MQCNNQLDSWLLCSTICPYTHLSSLGCLWTFDYEPIQISLFTPIPLCTPASQINKQRSHKLRGSPILFCNCTREHVVGIHQLCMTKSRSRAAEDADVPTAGVTLIENVTFHKYLYAGNPISEEERVQYHLISPRI